MQKLATLTVIALLGATPLSRQTLDLRIGTTRHEKTGFAAGLFTDRQVGSGNTLTRFRPHSPAP